MLKINKGDIITISCQGYKITGEVHSANNWTPEGWYIELIKANVQGGYAYWKQGYDGGSIIEVNGEVIENDKK